MKVNATIKQEVELDEETIRIISYKHIVELLGKRYGGSHHFIVNLRVLEYIPSDSIKFVSYRSNIEPEIGTLYLCEYSQSYAHYDILREGTTHDKLLIDMYKFIYYNSYNYNHETGKLDKGQI